MNTFFITLLVLFYITQGFVETNDKVNHVTPQPPPPYYAKKSTVYYYYNRDQISHAKLDIIFRLIKKYTCLKFERKTDSPIKDTIGINFGVSNNGNNVQLSRSEEKPTEVSLYKEVYEDYKLLSFFIGRALDLITEVMRPDRDSEVNVNMENVNQTFEDYFVKKNETDITYINDTEFDFGSPMLFNTHFGSKNNKKPTYNVTMYKDYQPSYGDGKMFRHNDYKHMHNYYCNTKAKPNDCEHGGYYPETSEFLSKCKCPKYLTGTRCTDLEPNKGEKCGSEKEFKATLGEKYFEVENNNGRCHYKIKSDDEKKKVKVTIGKIKFDKTNCDNGQVYLEVLFRKDKGAKGIYLCKTSEKIELPPLSSEVIVVFYGTANYGTNYLNISYQAIEEKNLIKKLIEQ